MRHIFRILLFNVSIFTSLFAFSQTNSPFIAERIESAIDSIEPPIPLVSRLFPYHIRDIAICRGPGHKYYLAGTTDDTWGVSEGIRVWESPDLKNWKTIGESGYVWTIEKDAVNSSQKEIKDSRGRKMRAIWAPEIHFLKNNFWITYSISAGYGSGLLRSTTGKPEGPYIDVAKDKPLVSGIDATLFEDKDGCVWYIWGDGKMKRMKSDMTGFENEEPPIYPLDADGKKVGYEGVNVYSKKGKYYLMAAEWNSEGPENGHLLRTTNENRRAADGRYDCMIAIADKLTGPYSKSYIAIPHGGHNMIFDDFEGNTWATMFGNDEAAAPFREQPAIVSMQISHDGKIIPLVPFPHTAIINTNILYVSGKGDNSKGTSWSTAFNSLSDAINKATPGTSIWVAKGSYSGGLEISGKYGLYIFGGFKGNEEYAGQRNPSANITSISGNSKKSHVIQIENTEYLRLDGFTISGGRATGSGENGCGAGIFLRGGGESVRFVNCRVTNNFAIRDGGGCYAINGASPLFVCCEFINNEAHENGGAVFIDCNSDNGYHTRFYNCNLSFNKAQSNGGVAWFRTDMKQTGTLRFINCLISNNFTLLEGGNIFMTGGATLLMGNCTVVNNTGVSSGTSVATLGNIPAQNRIINSIFHGNSGTVLFTANAYSGVDRITGFPQNWTIIQNCLFGKNKTLALFGYAHNMDRFFKAEEINGLSWAEENLDGDPLFGDEENGLFNLKPGSPAIDAATNDNFFPYDCRGIRRTISKEVKKSTINIGCYE